MGTTETASGRPKEEPVHWLANLLFKAMNLAVLPGWAAIALAPESKLTPDIVKAIMLYVGVVYAFSLLKGLAMGSIEGSSFTSLRGIRCIFRGGNDFVVNGCWAHYLAFDLGIAFAISQDALAEGVPKLYVAPCLVATLMYGPVGFMSWALLKAGWSGKF